MKPYEPPRLRELPWLAKILTPKSEFVLVRDGETFLVLWPGPGYEHRVFKNLEHARMYMQALLAMELG